MWVCSMYTHCTLVCICICVCAFIPDHILTCSSPSLPSPPLLFAGTKVNTAAFEGGRDPFKDAMDTLDDVLQSLAPMPIACAPREDPYASSSDDESAVAKTTRKKRSPSPLTDNTKRAAVKKEVTENGGTFTFSVDDELESPPPSDDEETFMDPLLDFDQQDSSFAFVSGGVSGKKAGTEGKDFSLEDFTSLVQGIAKSTQEKSAAKEEEQKRSKNMKDREREAELERARVKDKQTKEKEAKKKPAQPKEDSPAMVTTEVVFEPSFVKKKHARVAPPPPKKVTPPVSPTTKNEPKATPNSVTMDIERQREQKASPALEAVPKRESTKLASEEKKGGGGGYELPNGSDRRSASVEQTDFFPKDADDEPPYATVDQLVLGSDGTFVAKSDPFDPDYSTIPDLVVLEERPTAYEPPYASILELTTGNSLGTSPTMLPADDEAKSPSPQSGSQSPDVDEVPPLVIEDHPYSRVNKQAKQNKGKASQVSAPTPDAPSFAQVNKEKKDRDGELDDDPPYARVGKPKEKGDPSVDHKVDPPYAQVKKQKQNGDKPVKREDDPPYSQVKAQMEKGAEQPLEQADDPPYTQVKKQKKRDVEQPVEEADDPPYTRVKKQMKRDVEQPVEETNDPPYARVKKQTRHSKEKHTHADTATTSGLPDLADLGEMSATQDIPKSLRSGRDRRAKSPTSPPSGQSPEGVAAKPTSPVRKAPPLPAARNAGSGDDENPYSEISELILPLSQLGIQANASNSPKEEKAESFRLGTFTDSASASIERGKQFPRPTLPSEPEKRQQSSPHAVPSRQAPPVPKQHQTVAKTQSVGLSIAKQPKRFWKRLSVGDKGSKDDDGQVMLKGFQSHSDKPPAAIPETPQNTDSSKTATSADSEAPSVPPYRPSSPDTFPLSNRKGYVAQQQEGKALQPSSASDVKLKKKGGSGTGLTSQQLKAMRRLSIQGQSVSL